MNDQNPSLQPVVPPVSAIPVPPPSNNKGKALAIGGLVFFAVLVAGGYFIWSGFGAETPTLAPTQQIVTTQDIQEKTMESTLSFLGHTYKKGFSFPINRQEEYSTESYEWVKGSETVENWTALVTTHKLSPESASTPLSAEVYAQSAAAMQIQNGAKIIETSLINTAEAAAIGVDISNPPYLLIYAYMPTNGVGIVELNIQKIENIGEGKVGAFIYAQKVEISSEEDLNAFLASKPYLETRTSVVLEKFPY